MKNKSKIVVRRRPVIFFDEVNGNDRMYTKEITMPIVENFMRRKDELGVAYGMMGYPENGGDVNARAVSHTVDALYAEGDILFADITLLDNDNGRMLAAMIDSVVFRTNASGIQTEVDGKNVVFLDQIFSINAIAGSDDAFAAQQLKYDMALEAELEAIRVKVRSRGTPS